MRNAVAQTLFELAQQDERIVVVVADISPAGAMEDFRKMFPDRFINTGVAEASMIALAAGMAQRGFKVFCYTIATFALFRAFEQIRVDLAYQNLPVIVVGMGAGLSYSTLGATHQATEDVAVAVAMPNMTVLAPCDSAETAECVRWCAGRGVGGPVYMRIGKAGELEVGGLEPWKFGQPRQVRDSVPTDGRVMVSYGSVAREVLIAARRLSCDMMTISTLSPFDLGAVKLISDRYHRVLVIEEASGAPLFTQLRIYLGPKVRSLALPREFCHLHGTREELLDHYGLTAEKIVAALR